MFTHIYAHMCPPHTNKHATSTSDPVNILNSPSLESSTALHCPLNFSTSVVSYFIYLKNHFVEI